MIEYQKSPVMIRGQRQIATNVCILTCREYRQSLQPPINQVYRQQATARRNSRSAPDPQTSLGLLRLKTRSAYLLLTCDSDNV